MAKHPTVGELSNGSNQTGTQKDLFEQFALASSEGLGGAAEAAYTLSSGAIKPLVGVFSVASEVASSPDDLTTLTTEDDSETAGMAEGRVVLMRPANAAEDITVKHNTAGAGTVELADGADFVMTSTKSWLMLQRRSTRWFEIGRFFGDDIAAFRAFLGLTAGATAPDPDGSNADDGKTLGVSGSSYALLGPLRGLRNAFINGDFAIDQRNAGASLAVGAGASYPVDRWMAKNGGATVAGQRKSLPVGDSNVSEECEHYLELDVTGAGGNPTLEQRIEGVRSFAGKQVLLSIWAKADAAPSTPISVALEQNFGSGGSASSAVLTSAQTFTPTTSWVRYTFTFTLTSISGKTIDHAASDENSDHVAVRFTLPNEVRTYSLARAQVERGAVATPFEVRPPSLEWDLCQRFYLYSNAPEYKPGDAVGSLPPLYTTSSGTTSGLAATMTARLPGPMRKAPTLTLYSYSDGASGAIGRSTGGNMSAFSGASPTHVSAVNNGLTSDGTIHGASFAVDAEL